MEWILDCENCTIFGCGMRRDTCLAWCTCEYEWNIALNRMVNNGEQPCTRENCGCQVSIDAVIRLETIEKCELKLQKKRDADNAVKQFEIVYKYRYKTTPQGTWHEATIVKDGVYIDDAIIKVRNMYYDVKILNHKLVGEEEGVAA